MEPINDFYALNDRYCEARDYKLRWLALYKDLYLYVIPNRDAFNELFNFRDDGKPETQMIWDSTAMLSAYQRANDLHGLLLPKDRTWGKLILDPHMYDSGLIQKSQPLVDEINSRIFFYISQCNLSRAVSSSNLDLVGGTAALWVESISDVTPLYFRSIPSVSLFIEYSTDDLINNCWYANKMTARKISSMFPNYNGKMAAKLKEVPNETFIVRYGQIQVEEEKFFIYSVMDDDPFTPLFERESNYPQILIYRDRVRPGEAEGRGVGLDLIPIIKNLNRIVEYDEKSMAFKAYPPMFYEAGTYFNPYSIRQWAGAMIPRRPGDANPLEPMQMPTSPDVHQKIMAMQEFIKKGFMVDPLGEVDSPVKSATEISIRENRAQRNSSTDISRLINELPKQIYEVCAKILNERGLLIKKRQVIPLFNPKKMKFHYMSPLFDLQNQQDLNNFIQNLQIKQQFFGEGAALASVDLVEAQHFLTDKLNLQTKLFANDQKLMQFMKGMAAQQQSQTPQPTTSPTSVPLPQSQGVTI